MDDNNKIIKQNQQQAPTQPVSVGSASKETGPIAEAIQASHHLDIEPKISPEMADAGVEINQQRPNLEPEHIQMGVRHAGESTPIPTIAPSMSVPPMPRAQIKKESVRNSLRWLNELLMKLFKAAQLREREA